MICWETVFVVMCVLASTGGWAMQYHSANVNKPFNLAGMMASSICVLLLAAMAFECVELKVKRPPIQLGCNQSMAVPVMDQPITDSRQLNATLRFIVFSIQDLHEDMTRLKQKEHVQ
jgi:hypothetical protein